MNRNPERLAFLAQLEECPRNGFERHFAKCATALGLDDVLGDFEIRLLFEATYRARLCVIAFNGLGGCGGQIKAEREPNRSRLEREFMAARDEFMGSESWVELSDAQRKGVRQTFFQVAVFVDNLAE